VVAGALTQQVQQRLLVAEADQGALGVGGVGGRVAAGVHREVR
jgi:hypothetical protein